MDLSASSSLQPNPASAIDGAANTNAAGARRAKGANAYGGDNHDYLEVAGATGQGSAASAGAYSGYETMGRGGEAGASSYGGDAYESEPRGRTDSFA